MKRGDSRREKRILILFGKILGEIEQGDGIVKLGGGLVGGN